MPPITDPSKLSVRQFAEQFRGEMIPLSSSISYYCASVPMSEDDLKEYLFRRQAQKNFEGFVKDLRKKASIKVDASWEGDAKK